MFSFKIILFSSLALIIISFICSSSGKSTKIKTLAENAKLFFKQVKKLDRGLKRPKSLNKFRNLKYWTGIRRIKSNENHILLFTSEFEKLIEYTKKVVDDYKYQINIILQKREVGKYHERVKLCNFYYEKIYPKFQIAGFGKSVPYVDNLGKIFRNKLGELYNTIASIPSRQKKRKRKSGCTVVFCIPLPF